ncbi:MAG: inositol monophosphatase family protein [Gammaproteobacteria bacterium]|nr:inositol monophosphatase family protein [Gammaproteobacteria bacterium]MDH5800013.1 inositol monophosphatase family protein [Gammaproteobacteria bacterium]
MQLTPDDLDYLSDKAIAAAKEAGAIIASFADKAVSVQHKESGDTLASQVVTEVDLRSEKAIVEMLQPTCEQYDLALLTEETEDDKARLEKEYFWCADPLDGTLSFIESIPGYSVSIALVSRSGAPLIGVVYDPVTRTLYSAVQGQGVFRNGEPFATPEPQSLTAKPLALVCNRGFVKRPDYPRIYEALVSVANRYGCAGIRVMEEHGAVLNACRVLENPPAVYFMFPKPGVEAGGSLWDFAAVAALFSEAGHVASDFFGQPLALNRADSTFLSHRGVLFATDVSLAAEVGELYTQS